MGFYVSFNIEGEQQMSRNLGLLAGRVRDWTPAFEKTADSLVELFTGEVFDTEGGVIDESWQALSDKYAKRKNKKFPGKGLLEATGTMRNGFVSFADATHAEVWNDIEYFKYHQSNRPRTKMPRRVMIKLAEQQREQVVKVFQSYFQQIIAET